MIYFRCICLITFGIYLYISGLRLQGWGISTMGYFVELAGWTASMCGILDLIEQERRRNAPNNAWASRLYDRMDEIRSGLRRLTSVNSDLVQSLKHEAKEVAQKKVPRIGDEADIEERPL